MAKRSPKRRRTRPRRRRKLLTPARKRAISRRLVLAVVILQAALLLTLAVTPTDPPGGPRLFELIWAWMHKPTFYPLVALIVGGPILSWIAWQTPSTPRSPGSPWQHRRVLIGAWVIFLTILASAFGERVAAMLRVLWWQVNR